MMSAKNELHRMTCQSFGSDAVGVCRHEGMAVFVPGMLPGEEGIVRLVKLEKRYAYGRLEQLLLPSPDRRTPPCPIAAKCGGCSCQHMCYEASLIYKRSQAEELIRRIGGCEVTIPPMEAAVDPWHYRNKGTYPISSDASGRPLAGFFRPRSHDLVPLPREGCRIQRMESSAAVHGLLAWMEQEGVRAYDERTGRGSVRHLMTRTTPDGRTVLTLVVMNGVLPHSDTLVPFLQEMMPELSGIAILRKPRADNAILDGTLETLWGETDLLLPLCGYRFRVSPKAFFQVNPAETERLYSIVRDFAALTGKEHVLDAYCGAGTISLALSEDARSLLGIEIVPEAIENAKENAERNSVPNVQFRCGAVEDLLPPLVEEGYQPNVIILDPPRKGCDPAVLKAAAAANPTRIVYVACGIASLARDVARLRELGYVPQMIRCVDLFCWTGDVETVCLFTRP
ncbi:MAG: 23S rRNA (uracil(1939)-C(5))-methyltransferase RlmD [Clostridiales bacterium]|nr:23S rRNA (uracil(1939)-C(5))-methyltransferase RlmD [Clostridiales bacterium]